MRSRSVAFAVTAVTLFSCVQVYGHRPIEAKQTPDRTERALRVRHPDHSQVYYAALEAEQPQAWFRFEGREQQELSLSVGVPVILRLKGYRPAAALIGPGLGGAPADELQFEVPAGLGVRVFHSQGEPRFFHEPFTGTDSWIHIEQTVRLAQSGIYYLVAFTPRDPRPGDRLWMSVGTKERFKLWDLFSFRRWRRNIRRFHECDRPPHSNSKR